MQSNHSQIIDYFKLFKVFDLKKIENKQGQVKVINDKALGRKVISIQGNVSTQNYITFNTSQITKTQPNQQFYQKYLYILCLIQNSKNMSFQLNISLNSKVYKFLFSTIYKSQKLTSNGVIQMPLNIKSGKWTIMVMDLYELCEKHSGTKQIRLSFRVDVVQIRANSKIKNIFLSDHLYDPCSMPKDMELPLKSDENFYMKYNYVFLGTQDKISQQEKINQPNIKQSKNIQSNPQQIKNKTHKSQQRQVSIQRKKIEEQSFATKKMDESKVKNSSKISGKSKKSKINPPQSYNFQQISEQMPLANNLPKPKTTITCSISGIQGRTISVNGINSLQAFITAPSIFAVHKPIKCMSLHKKQLYKLIVGYNDGSLCIWDIIRQKSLCYMKTQLMELKQIQIIGQSEEEQKIFIVGNDKMKRQTILIINRTDILFRQISNYSIHGFIVCHSTNSKDQGVMVSYGYQNIRLWKLNPHNHIITGVGLYLGKVNRRVTYTSACQINNKGIVLVVDNSGYLTCVSMLTQKMEQMIKISENALDQIMYVQQISKILISQSSGNIKVLSLELKVLQQFELANRIKCLSYNYNQSTGECMLHIDHYNNSTATFDMNNQEYKFVSRQHSQKIIGIAYSSKLNKIVSISKDNTVRIWALMSSSYAQPNSNISNVLGKGLGTSYRNRLQYEIKEEYQFLISNGQTMHCLALDSQKFAYVGFSEGIVRKIDIQTYQIVQQKAFQFRSNNQMNIDKSNSNQTTFIITSINISRNSKYLLICVSQTLPDERCRNKYVILCDNYLNIVQKYNPPTQASISYTTSSSDYAQVLAGFSETHKKFYICWTFGAVNRVQVFPLFVNSEELSTATVQFYVESMPKEIRLVEQFLHVDGVILQNGQEHHTYQIYREQNGQLIQALTLPIQSRTLKGIKSPQSHSHRTNFPILIKTNPKQQLQIASIDSSICESVDMPELVENINVCNFWEGPIGGTTPEISVNSGCGSGGVRTGMVLCTGAKSNALYAVSFEIRNIEQLNRTIRVGSHHSNNANKNISQSNKQYISNDQNQIIGSSKLNGNILGNILQQQQQQLQCVQSKMIKFNENQIQNSSSNNNINNTISKKHNNNNSTNRMKLSMQSSIKPQSRTKSKIGPESKINNYINASIKNSELLEIQQQQPSQMEYSDISRRQTTKLTSIYHQQQKIYQQCKQYIIPQLATTSPEQSQNSQETGNTNSQYNPLKYLEAPTSQPSIQLMYGWHNSYSYGPQQLSTKLIYNSRSQSVLFLSHRNLILHYFSQPIKQKIVRLPAYPHLICQLSGKYVAVGLGNQIRLFNAQLVFLRSFTCFGQKVADVCLSLCQGYLITLTQNPKTNKSYLQILDITTSSILSSTYCPLVPGSHLQTNPFHQPLQFLLQTPTSIHFYRLTSILTLQTQQLDNLTNVINSTNMGSVRCAVYLGIQDGGSGDGAEEVILLGMGDGSVIVVDSRTAAIMVIIRNVCKFAIKSITYSRSPQQKQSMIILTTQSSSLYKYPLKHPTLQCLINTLSQSPKTANSSSITQTKSQTSSSNSNLTSNGNHKPSANSGSVVLTTDSEIMLQSGVNKMGGGNCGMLVLTKLGALWLVDVTDNDTIKVMSVHGNNNDNHVQTSTITKAIIANQHILGTQTDPNNLLKNLRIITGSQDGTVKQTSLYNLQQVAQIYKPRRVVNDILISNGTLIVAFNSQVYFYRIEESNPPQWHFLGSLNFKQLSQAKSPSTSSSTSTKIVGIKSIPFTDNYIICTGEKLFLLYHHKVASMQQNKLKVDVQEICGDLHQACEVDVLGDAYVMVRDANKIGVWMRKDRRGETVINQLRKVQQVVYYMMDIYQVSASHSQFLPSPHANPPKQYQLLHKNSGLLQVRDFQQHSIIRQVELPVQSPTIMCLTNQGSYVIGDEEGFVWVVGQNGLTLSKLKVFDGRVGGLSMLGYGGGGGGKVLVYGPNVAVVNI